MLLCENAKTRLQPLKALKFLSSKAIHTCVQTRLPRARCLENNIDYTLVNFFFFLPNVDLETNMLFNKREEVVKSVSLGDWVGGGLRKDFTILRKTRRNLLTKEPMKRECSVEDLEVGLW